MTTPTNMAKKKKQSDQSNFNFFNPEGGQKDRDEAIERVGGNAEPAWKGASLDIGYELARPKTWFSTDEIWRGLSVRGIEPPHEPRSMGWVMTKLQKDGVIEPGDDMRPSAIRKCHHRPKRMWRGK